jgi:ABC-type lipoprotein export system ATPase subunit
VADIFMKIHKEWTTIFLITHDIHLLNYLKEKYNIKTHLIK